MKDKAIILSKDAIYNPGEISRILIALAQDNARSKLEAENVTSVTDNTSGTASASYAIEALTLPSAYVVTGTTAAPKAGFDTAIAKLSNAADSLAAYLNKYRTSLGIPKITLSGATVTSAIAALDKTLTAVDGSSNTAVEATSGRQQLVIAQNNFSTLARAVNDIAVSQGLAVINDLSKGAALNGTIKASAATAAGVAGTASAKTLADTVVDAFLTSLANNYATLIAYVNDVVLNPTVGVTLTDNSSGTASGTVAAFSLPAVYTVSGTNAAPKAGFDTLLTAVNNNFADVVTSLNQIIKYNAFTEIDLLVDSTGGTGDTTVAAMANLTAVTGTGGTAVDQATARTRLTAIKNNVATVVATVNLLSDKYGIEALVDSSGGSASASNTVVAVGTATAAGVDGTSNSTLNNADVSTYLGTLRNAFASIAARIALLDNVGGTRPLQVVAVL